MSKALQMAIYVSLIKKTEVLLDVVDYYASKNPNMDVQMFKDRIEESLEDDLKSVVKMAESGRGINSGILDHINRHIVASRKMIGE